MTKLFIANVTRQKQRVFYRLDYDKEGTKLGQVGTLPKHQDIDPGRQEAVGGELAHVSQAQTIIDQLSKYGLRPADEVNRLNRLTPYIYSLDKPVSRAAIEKAFQFNQGNLAKEGKDRREAAAIAAGNLIDSDEAKISIEQVTESELGGDQITEGYTVDKTPGALEKSDRQGRRTPRRASL